jgi:3-hydroxyacyl-CoA dehydrogenase/enoyl-CoA hydratase/3-hydroxybutyryl-CoA epimerase
MDDTVTADETVMSDVAVKHWRMETDGDGIVWLALDKMDAGTNVLSAAVVEELALCLDAIAAGGPRGLIIHSAKPSGFIAGADVKEFTTLTDHAQAMALLERAHATFDRLDALPFPTLCLIRGFCLGGGLELALACRYRVAEDDPRTQLGLPEVKLGIHPGFGGTVRAVRLLGPVAAMDLMLTGRTLDARRAEKAGLVDHAVPERHITHAARAMILTAPAPRRPKRWAGLANHAAARPWVARLLRRKVAAHARREHYPAPYALIDLWQRYGDNPREMLLQERRSVAALITGSTAQNLVRVFFLQDRLKALGRKDRITVGHVHVVGGGVMGGDIAAWCALRGLMVTVQDQNREALARVVQRAHELFKQRLRQPRLVQAAMDRLMPDERGIGVPRADVVIEAIFENADAKRALYHDIEPRLKPTALLATNTSSIPLEELSRDLARPERLVGLHFFNPVAKMQLVEVVSGDNTAPETAAQAAAFARHIDRLPLPVKSAPGFLVNRVLMPYLLEAVVLAEEGVPPAAIDRAAVDFGMPMGPLELADTVGLDICLSVAEILAGHYEVSVPAQLRHMVEAKQLGRKSGRGFYVYKAGRPQRGKPDRGYTPPPDLTQRLLFRLFNECAACLNEGVVADADLIDAGVIFGTGFAPFRGGPMHYLRQQGMASQLEVLGVLEQRYGHRFAANEGWRAAVRAG